MVGVRVNYYAEIDIDGFSKLIDLVGGVDINNPTLLNDPSTGTCIPAGPVHLDGTTALQYVRSRETTNDYARANRQQIVMIALEKKLATPAMLPMLGSLLARPASRSRPTSRSRLPGTTSTPPSTWARSRNAFWGRPTTTIPTPRLPAAHGPAGSNSTRWPTSRSSSSGPTAATTAGPTLCRCPARTDRELRRESRAGSTVRRPGPARPIGSGQRNQSHVSRP